MWARRLFSHQVVRTIARYVSKIYVTCLWSPKESPEKHNISLMFGRNFSRSMFLQAFSFALLRVQSINSKLDGPTICSAQWVVTIIWGRAHKYEHKEVNSGRVSFIHIPVLVLFSLKLSDCMMRRGSTLRKESCELNCNLKR